MVDISEYFNILELTSHVAVQSGEGNRGLRFGLGDAWHVLAVFGSLEEFGERGVNHLLCSTQSKPSYTLTSFSVLMRPPWVSLSYISWSLLLCSSSKGGTSACNVVTVLLSIVNKRLWRQFLCGIYGCLDRAHSTFVR